MHNYFKALLQVAVILTVGIGSIWLASLLIEKEEKPEEIAQEIIKQVILKRPNCPDVSTSFMELKDKGQIVTLTKDLNSYGADGFFINKKFTIVKSTGSGSQVACGYLYIKAHAKDRPLQRQWENPFIRPGQFGGHIVYENAISDKDFEKKSEFLFNLSNIAYKETLDSPETRKADWASLLNVTDKILFEIALNTTDSSGTIDEVSIAYQCWNPETGQTTSDCRLMLQE